MRRRMTVCLFLLGLLLGPRMANAQTIQYVFNPPKNADLLLAGGIGFYPIKVADRVYLGGNAMLGGLRDDSDPFRFGESHWHLTWLVGPSAAIRVAGSFGVTVGYDWGFVRQSAKTHLRNYQSVTAGVTFGLRH